VREASVSLRWMNSLLDGWGIQWLVVTTLIVRKIKSSTLIDRIPMQIFLLLRWNKEEHEWDLVKFIWSEVSSFSSKAICCCAWDTLSSTYTRFIQLSKTSRPPAFRNFCKFCLERMLGPLLLSTYTESAIWTSYRRTN